MTILLDNGHGVETPGKRSPVYGFGQLFEWEFNRAIVNRVSLGLYKSGIRAIKIVPENWDVSLGERCRRANEWAKKEDCVLISVHANAGGGTGFEVFTSPGVTKADAIAEKWCGQIRLDFPEMKLRTDMTDGDRDKEAGFYILKHTACPAILTENLFMDNKKDCELLLDEGFRERLAGSYIKFIKSL